MTRIQEIRAELVEFVPSNLENGILYVSQKYRTAAHLCCCGCGSKVVTPLKPGGWQVAIKKNSVTLHPSVGSWNLPCQSHYLIRGGLVIWSSQISPDAIAATRRRDQQAREFYFDNPAKSWWQSFLDWILFWR